MDTEPLRILANLTASERRLYRALGGTIPRNLPLPEVEWADATKVWRAKMDADSAARKAQDVRRRRGRMRCAA